MAAPGPRWYLKRREGNHERLLLRDGEEITLGRGLGVTYQLTSILCPLMISRVHCILRQNGQSQWTITDNQSLNGVWLNKERLEPRKSYVLTEGTCIQLGVPLPSNDRAEFVYDLIQECLEQDIPSLSRSVKPKVPRTKRKFNSDESEASGAEGPSNFSKAKVHRVGSRDGAPAKCSHKAHRAKHHSVMVDAGALQDQIEPNNSTDGDELPPTQRQCRGTLQLTKVRQTMQEIRRLNVQMQEKQLEMQEKLNAPHASKSANPRDVLTVQKELHELQNQLSSEREEHLHRVQELRQIFQEEQEKQGERKMAEEHLKDQLAQALQEHTLLMEELNRNKTDFEQIIQAKERELQETKEEKEKARVQKEEVLSHMNDVLDNELQCIICSENFIEAVTLNCAHSFCFFCITEWRKRKDECPICRQQIVSQTRSLVLDNCINRMVDKLSAEMKERRAALIAERKDARQPQGVIAIQSESESGSLPSDALYISSSSDIEDLDFEFWVEYDSEDFWDSASDDDDDDDDDDSFFII
ncbi:E3 ubiquitin-protein ligase RNF8 isoform X2 [Spea bombifrons]|uniref:E3 ubiquitin-protein ligase RNF8 isoform X2 n=1 Tax=Spea bombifrons TaxID=233779 RepID=UPI00234B4296|nr:E3 ubiquitin-protein ligase RNF8 isoform X2 [Spea bombifrons]